MLKKMTLLSLFVGLCACGGQKEDQSAEAPAAPATEDSAPAAAAGDGPLPLSATDVLGGFEGTVTGLALSRNPDSVLDSAVIVGNGAAGLALVPTSQTRNATMIDFGGAVAAATATQSEGGPLIVVERADGRVSFRTFGANRDSLQEIAALEPGALAGRPRALCALEDHVFRIDADGGVTVISARTGAEGPSFETTVIRTDPALDCTAAGDRIYVLKRDGRIAAFNPDGTVLIANVADLPGTNRIAAMPLTEGAPVIFAVLDDGTVRTGETVFRLKVAGQPVAVDRLAFGRGNFGAVYRNGVAAIVTSSQGLVVLSWLALADQLSLAEDTRPMPPSTSSEMSAPVTIEVPDLALPTQD